jgi:hypothetical protein
MTGGSHSGAPADLDLRFHDWRALIEQPPLAVYINRLDEWSSNLYTSPQIEAMLGYAPEEWTGDDHLLRRWPRPTTSPTPPSCSVGSTLSTPASSAPCRT